MDFIAKLKKKSQWPQPIWEGVLYALIMAWADMELLSGEKWGCVRKVLTGVNLLN